MNSSRLLTDKQIAEAYGNEAEKYPNSLGAPLYYGKWAVAKAQDAKTAQDIFNKIEKIYKGIGFKWSLERFILSREYRELKETENDIALLFGDS